MYLLSRYGVEVVKVPPSPDPQEFFKRSNNSKKDIPPSKASIRESTKDILKIPVCSYVRYRLSPFFSMPH